VAEVELHQEVVAWLDSLVATEWDRAVVVIDRLADLGPSARINERNEVARARKAAED